MDESLLQESITEAVFCLHKAKSLTDLLLLFPPNHPKPLGLPEVPQAALSISEHTQTCSYHQPPGSSLKHIKGSTSENFFKNTQLIHL